MEGARVVEGASATRDVEGGLQSDSGQEPPVQARASQKNADEVWEEAIRQMQSGRLTKSCVASNSVVADEVKRLTSSEKEDTMRPSPDLLQGQEPKPGTPCAQRLQRCVNLWAVQAFCMFLALIHCVAYYLNWEQFETQGNISGRMAMIWCSLLPLVFINIFEVLVGVAAQGGHLLYLSSWMAFYSLVFHQFEAIFVIFLAYRFGRSTYLLYLFLQEAKDFSGFNYTTDRLTVPIVICYRLFRAYGIYFNINLQAYRLQREMKKDQADWWEEHESLLRAHRARLSVRLQELVNTKLFQAVITLVILGHFGIYSLSRADTFLAGYFYLSKFTGYFVVAVFTFEFIPRACARGGFEAFFCPVLHKLEAIFAVWGVFMTAYSSYYHFAIVESRAALEPSGVLTAVALIIHRLIRCFGIYLGIDASDQLDRESLMEAAGSKFFRQKFQNILKLPEGNMKVRYSKGQFTISVRKAEIRSSAFEGLHLPVTIRGGIVEDLYVRVKNDTVDDSHLPVSRLTRLRPKKPMTIVSVTNLLVLFGPGDGLAEAGGVEPMGHYWNHDTIRVAKAKLVELIHVHLSAPPEQQEDADAGSRPSQQFPSGAQGASEGQTHQTRRDRVRAKARRFLLHAKERAAELIKQACLQHVEIDVRRVNFQFDDLEGCLGVGPMSIGARLGEATVDAHRGKYIQCRVLRMGAFVEHRYHGKAGDSGRPLQELLKRHPESAKRELERLCRVGIFRTWAFEELERLRPVSDRLRHVRTEALQNWREVFSLSKLCFNAGPERGHLRRRQETESLDDVLVAIGPKDAEAEPQDSTWKWSLDLTPVRISLDEMQARCVKTVVACVQAWSIHDNSFKWWPFLHLHDVDIVNDHRGRVERSSIVRLWWLYAIHRVLAMKRLRPKFYWMDVMWRARSYQTYKGLVTRIAWRAAAQAQQPLTDFARGWEKVHLEELQMQLGLADIIDCRKKALVIIQQKGYLSHAARHSHQWQEGVSKAREKMTKHLRTTGLSSNRSSGHTGGSGRSSTASRQRHHDPTSSQASSWAKWDSSSSTQTPRRMRTVQGNLPTQVQGIWEVNVPVVEARILRCNMGGSPSSGAMRRPLLLLAASGLFVDASVEASDEGAVFGSAAVTVDYFRARCPEADALIMGGTRHLCTVMDHFALPPPSSGMLAGRRVGEAVAFAFRGQMGASGKSTCEVHLPDLRVIIYEPLLLVLMTYAKLDPVPPERWLEPNKKQRQLGASQALGKHSQLLLHQTSTNLTVHSSRWGPMKSQFEINDSDLSSMSECRAKLHHRSNRIRDARRIMRTIHSSQNRFELLSGLAGSSGEMQVHFNVGAIHCTQVGEYSRTHMLVEQCRVWPFKSEVFRGPVDEWQEREHGEPEKVCGDASAHQFLLRVNGFDEASVAAWDDGRWRALRSDRGAGPQSEGSPPSPSLREAPVRRERRASAQDAFPLKWLIPGCNPTQAPDMIMNPEGPQHYAVEDAPAMSRRDLVTVVFSLELGGRGGPCGELTMASHTPLARWRCRWCLATNSAAASS